MRVLKILIQQGPTFTRRGGHRGPSRPKGAVNGNHTLLSNPIRSRVKRVDFRIQRDEIIHPRGLNLIDPSINVA